MREPSWGDGEVLRTTGILGTYAGIFPLIIARELEDPRSRARSRVRGSVTS